jgi:hypothetical protein
MDIENHLLTTGEAAVRSGLNPRTIINRIQSGDLPAVKRGGIWWIRPEDADALQVKPRGRKSHTLGPGEGRSKCASCGGWYLNLYRDPWGGTGQVCRRCWEERKK